MNLRQFGSLLKDTMKEWQEDYASSKAAALAYYTTFAMAPLLVVVLAIAGLTGGREAAQSLIMRQVEDLIGPDGREFVQSMIENATVGSTGWLATIIGTVTLLIGALGAFNQLQKALNRIWEVEAKPITRLSQRVKDFIMLRVLSFTMIIGIGFLLLVSLVVNAGLAAIGDWLNDTSELSGVLLNILNAFVSLGLITVLFAMIFKFIPDVKVTWRNVWLGAILTALLFTIGKSLIGVYLGASQIGTSFGAAGSLVLIMIWIYYSSQIVFFGAEFTQVYTKWISGKPQPTEHANDVEVTRKVSKK